MEIVFFLIALFVLGHHYNKKIKQLEKRQASLEHLVKSLSLKIPQDSLPVFQNPWDGVPSQKQTNPLDEVIELSEETTKTQDTDHDTVIDAGMDKRDDSIIIQSPVPEKDNENIRPVVEQTEDENDPFARPLPQQPESIEDFQEPLVLVKQEELKTPDEPIKQPQKKKQMSEAFNFENQFGRNIPVWLGGMALACSGFFLVKYSIDMGLLTPVVRLILGALLGLALLTAGHIIRQKPNFANGQRIAQALTGAGLADLYGCIFAATSVYEMLHPLVGFAGMAGVTVSAVVLSLRYGMPIAALGLLGGLVAPALVGSHNPQAVPLLAYLYCMIAGSLTVMKRQQWWGLSALTVLGGFAWVILWVLSGNYNSADNFALTLFMMALSGTVFKVFDKTDTGNSETNLLLNWFKKGTLATTAILTPIIMNQAPLGIMDWALMGMISVGSVMLAVLREKEYDFMPWLCMILTSLTVASAGAGISSTALLMLIGGFTTLYAGAGLVLEKIRRPSLPWTFFTLASLAVGFGLSFIKIEIERGALLDPTPYAWSGLALALAVFSGWKVKQALGQGDKLGHEYQPTLGIYTAFGLGMLNTAALIELPFDTLIVFTALQGLALSWLNNKVNITALKHAIKTLFVATGVMLFPVMLFILSVMFGGVIEGVSDIGFMPATFGNSWPVFQLLMPAVCMGVSSVLLRRQKDDKTVENLEISSLVLGTAFLYSAVRMVFGAGDMTHITTLLEADVITNLFGMIGVGLLALSGRISRRSVTVAGTVLTWVAIARIGCIDFILKNPLWTQEYVGSWPVLNGLLVSYGLPLVWLVPALKQNLLKGENLKRYGYGGALVLLFTLVTLNVRQMFHGGYLSIGATTNMEIYTYSAVWLLMSIALLVLGTIRSNQAVRIASLVFMIGTVGKVFLYDAAALEGLYRVFSFMGLGVSLIGISWFYTKFVFAKANLE